MAVVRKARKAGALFEGREPSHLTLKTLRFTGFIFVKGWIGKDERGTDRGRRSVREVGWRESLRGKKAQESRRPRPGLTLRVARRGTAFQVRSSRWSVDTRPMGWVGERRSGGVERKLSTDHLRGERL
jgi:hypothetical protein